MEVTQILQSQAAANIQTHSVSNCALCVEMEFWGASSILLLLLAVAHVRGQQTLSEEEAAEILNAHNYYRSLVDPIASNMLKLVIYHCIVFHSKLQFLLSLFFLTGMGCEHGIQC